MRKWLIPIVAICAIVLLETIAMLNGINGNLAALAFTAIGSIATGGTIKIWGHLKGKGIDLQVGNKEVKQ